jgi:hypothetical protein
VLVAAFAAVYMYTNTPDRYFKYLLGAMVVAFLGTGVQIGLDVVGYAKGASWGIAFEPSSDVTTWIFMGLSFVGMLYFGNIYHQRTKK